MTQKQIMAIACALFHEGLDVESLSAKAKAELRAAVDALLASSPLSSKEAK